MKTSDFSRYLALIIVAGALTLSSCRKKEKEVIEEPDTEQGTANDNNMAEGIVNDIDLMGSQVSENGSLTTFKTSGASSVSGGILGLSSLCATITGVGTQTVVVNFGNVGCLGLDGRVRTGQLTYNFSASSPSTAVRYRNPGFSMTVSSQNYVVDGNQVNIINKTITNSTPVNIPTGPNPGTNLTWGISANVSITKAGTSNAISWVCNRTKELLNTSNSNCYNGQSSPINWTQAQIQLNGSSAGVNARGENYTANATNLIKYFTCSPDPNRPRRHPFISGTISYTPGTRPTRLINFGSVTSCDLNATLTVNNQTYTITLP
ncbi:MAG: hypothetical protein V4635_00485 [Bacteroidota bacterium]